MDTSRGATLVTLVAPVVLAGCGGSGSAPGPAVVDESPATLPADAAREAGYDPAGATNCTVNTSVTLSISGDVELDVTREVSATVPVRRYVRSTVDGPVHVSLVAVPLVRPIPDRPAVRTPVTRTPSRLATFRGSGEDAPAPADATFDRVDNVTVTFLGAEASLSVDETTTGGT